MTKMMQLVEEMRARLDQISDTEQTLVRALGDALSRVDQKLLQDVRSISIEHEARRGAILLELQTLASRIGAFPTAREPMAGIEYSEPAARSIGSPHNGHEVPYNRGPEPAGHPHMADAMHRGHEAGHRGADPIPFPRNGHHHHHAHQHAAFNRGGDWRQAANNIEDELDVYFKDAAAH
jgi:hypothetical protein